MASRRQTGMRVSIAVMLTVAAFAAGGCTSDSNPAAPAPPPWLAPNAPKPTFTLSGVVTEATKAGGAPVEGAFVQELRSGLRAITNADGRYSISGLLAGDVHVRTAKDGFLTLTSQVKVGTDARLDVRVVRDTPYVLSGVVFEITPTGRQPAEGIELYCNTCGSPDGHTITSTDERGRYSFFWSTTGIHALVVWTSGYELAEPDGKYASGKEYINATVDGDTHFDIEVVRRR